MIEFIRLLRNIGQFDNVVPPQEVTFTPFSLVYGENGRGKTTLAAVFRSLATNKGELITERQRLGAPHPPHVVIDHAAGQAVFENAVWKRHLPNIAIFDDTFVSDNVCSGIELQTGHRQNLHELILGSRGVALNDNLQGHVRRIEEHNSTLRDLAAAIPAGARGPFSVDVFCNLEPDPNIDTKIQEAERRLAAAKAADAIRQRPGFRQICLPDFDIDEIAEVLGRTLTDLEAASAERVRDHIVKLGRGGEAWVSDGVARIESVSQDLPGEVCPFCAQDIQDHDLITHYRSYFSEAYEALKTTIRRVGAEVHDTHAGDAQSSFERDIRTAVQAREFWKEFIDLPPIEIDTAAVVRRWNAARESVLKQLRAKAAAPLEPITIAPETHDSILQYRECLGEVHDLSSHLVTANDGVAIVKEQAAADDRVALTTDLARLTAHKARFDPTVGPQCDAYLVEKAGKEDTEEKRTHARTALDHYRTQIFPAYETAINDYLQRFGASFRLGEVRSVNTRAGSSASYFVVINHHRIDVSTDDGRSFRNTLSSGDRNTLALAFFFASLEQDTDLENKIVVIDDPMTSLDEHRTLRTREEIRTMAARVQQMIVMSHSKSFLCNLWEQADKNITSTLRFFRAGDGSNIAQWDVRDDSISEHDKHHDLVRTYLQIAEPEKERKVAQALRPILEAFIRVAYPEYSRQDHCSDLSLQLVNSE